MIFWVLEESNWAKQGETFDTSSCSFLSTAILPAVSCTPSIPGFVDACTSPAAAKGQVKNSFFKKPGCRGAASLTGATTVGGGMLVSLGGDCLASLVFLVEGSVNDS